MTDIRNLDLNLLKTFDALFEERNVTRAADRLALSQPSVSGMLTRLREAFDDPLFVRSQRGVVPTERAVELAPPVKRLLCEVEALLQPPVFVPATADFTLTIAATDYDMDAVIVPFLAALRVRAPNVRVAVRGIESQKIHAQLEQGELDLVLLTPELTPPNLHTHALYDERYVCALRSDHPAASGGALTLEQFCSLDHVVVSYAGPAFEGATDTALAAIGRTRRVTVSVGCFLTIPKLLRDSELIAVVPRRLGLDEAGLTLVELPLEVPGFTKTLVWHERTNFDAGKRWARTLMMRTSAPIAAGRRLTFA